MAGCIFIPLIIIGALTIYPHAAKGDVEPEEVQVVQVMPPNGVPETQAALEKIATEAAIRHGVNVEHFLRTGRCEIKKRQLDDGTIVWDYMAQSDHVYRGVQENSWGYFQINLDYHPDVSKEQAQNPYWAADWSAEQFASDGAGQWTCWRKFYS